LVSGLGDHRVEFSEIGIIRLVFVVWYVKDWDIGKGLGIAVK
jgi:hypothetical protein